MSRMMLIEFNELCPSLLDRFMERGMLPNFRRFYETSQVFTTDAGEQHPNLEPWIQWPTVHSGMSFAEHGVFHLGDGKGLRAKCAAEALSDAGIPVGICGSMNVNYEKLNGYLVPDPWDKEGTAHPDWLQTYYETVSRQVRDSSKEDGMSKGDMLRFGWFLLQNGLTPATGWAIFRQLASEKFDKGLRWRRACLLDRLQYDLFRGLNRRFGVRFATFFCNSTAHFQHYYWRNMEPERFTVPPPATDHASLADAIPTGYRNMDLILGRLLRDYPDATLMLCTALSQQPWVETTKCTFRPRQFDSFLAFARVSVNTARVSPVMAEEFHVEYVNEVDAKQAELRLQDLMVGDQPVMKVERSGNRIFAGCRINDTSVQDRPVVRKSDGARQRFSELFNMVHTMRSGRHHPDGVLWVRTGQHRVHQEKVPLTAVAPTILSHFGITPPETMTAKPLPILGCKAINQAA